MNTPQARVLAWVMVVLGVAAAAAGVQPTPVSDRAQDAAASTHTPLRAIVSIAPLRGLVEPLVRAAGSEAPVEMLIPPGRSEHGHEIPPSKLAGLRDADLVVLVGLGLEPQLEKYLAALPPRTSRPRQVILFADAVGERADPGEAGEHHHHDHGPDGECDHYHGADPHLWLDPVLVERFVGVLTETVAQRAADATAGARVRAAGDDLRKRVLAVHEQYAVRCGGFNNKTVVVGHDAWRRLADRYGLETVAIAGLTAGEPTPKALERAKATVREKGLKAVFVEPQLSDRAGRRIADATGVQVRRLDPLGDGDWFAMMESNLKELGQVLGAPAAASPSEGTGPAPAR